MIQHPRLLLTLYRHRLVHLRLSSTLVSTHYPTHATRHGTSIHTLQNTQHKTMYKQQYYSHINVSPSKQKQTNLQETIPVWHKETVWGQKYTPLYTNSRIIKYITHQPIHKYWLAESVTKVTTHSNAKCHTRYSQTFNAAVWVHCSNLATIKHELCWSNTSKQEAKWVQSKKQPFSLYKNTYLFESPTVCSRLWIKNK